jgi:hypothetical protein
LPRGFESLSFRLRVGGTLKVYVAIKGKHATAKEIKRTSTPACFSEQWGREDVSGMLASLVVYPERIIVPLRI